MIQVISEDISSKFLYEPQNTTTWIGSVAQFSCQIRNALPPATIEWRKNGILLSSNERVLIFDRGVLQIKETTKSDEGEYSCTARNVVHARLSQSASLFVETGVNVEEKRLKFLGTPHNVTVVQGDKTVLDCAATGFPTPVVTWKKLTGNPRVFDKSFWISNLEFVNVTESDGGEFKCQASSGRITISKTVWLIVRAPPRFTKIPDELTLVTDGDALLTCEVTGSPPPSLFWLKNGNKVIPSETTKVTDYTGGTSLKLVNPDSKDGGIFQCFAENQLGNIQTIAAVIIHRSSNQPGPPTNLVAVALSSSSIVLSWSPPTPGNFTIQGYVVHYQRQGGSEEQQILDNKTHFEFKNLYGFINYTFFVRAYGDLFGRQSKSVTQRTQEGIPSWPPEIVNVTSLTPDSLDLAWKPPPKLSQNGVIVKYSIEWRQEGRRGWQASTTEVPGHFLHKTINGLAMGKTYIIKVCAGTAKGWGKWSQPVTAKVLNRENNVISAPSLWIGHQNATALQVRLLPPRYGKELVKDYRLFYVRLKSSETEQGPLIIEKHHKEYLLTGLRPGAEYLIKVMAWDGQRLGQPGAVYATTSQDPYGEVDGNHKILAPPPRPINLQCAVESPTSLLLTWESPISSALRTSYYTVKYHLKRSRNPQQKTLTVETKSIILNGLRSEKVYDIFVQSHYKTKTSRFQSEHSTAQIDCSISLPGPSSPPRNVNFKYESHDSIEVTWEKPTETNGQLMSYEIYFTNNSTLPDSEWSVRRMLSGFIGHNSEKMYRRLWRLKLDTPFYFKIRAENGKGYGPFCKTIEVRPPIWMPRVNVSYTIISPKLVQLSWACPNNFNSAAVKRFTILITNNKNDPEGSWEKLSFVPSKKCSMVVTKTIAVSQYKVHFMKVRAEYGEKTPGKWSNLIEISTGNQSTAALRVQEPNDDPRFNIKLGIIIGCAIAAFCLVILGLFIIWRNPCRQPHMGQGKEMAPTNDLSSPLNGFLPCHQQVIASGKTDNSLSTEETSAGSGASQCRCTCGAASQLPLGNSVVQANSKLPGSSDSTSPLTRVFF
ncbi:immunoglobulin superfamily DCC subclass member 4-like isoform X2 [Acropora millepora]|uniref:immunoglobulin superfamily DCC subclass member 4-like isoform X2 n=1 Tax=Acropora millepora TaxID=45264 RepID=UPI001CF55180|nr:immunoglobulin superfamily DCC subclass member 4-like isoform X2 [Acropora millepora]